MKDVIKNLETNKHILSALDSPSKISLLKNIKRNRHFFLDNPSKILLYPTYRKLKLYTLVPFHCLCQMYDFIIDVQKKGIRGSIVEMGCWRGGCGAFMAKYAKGRDVWLFDSFEGLPETEYDTEKAKRAEIRFSLSSATVKHTQEALDICSTKATIIEGWFNETVSTNKKRIGDIAILRLDGDVYESTKYCLEQLYDQVSEGGYIVIDDYHGWEGCRRALYEFFVSRNICPRIIHTRWGRAYFRKI